MANQNRRPVALVTGASRGVGKAIAVALAAHGYDLVITGRTMEEGSAVNPANGQPLPGSLRTTADEIAARGTRCFPVQADILDLDDVPKSFDRCLTVAGGQLDLLVNNAIYVGPGNDSRLADIDPTDIVRRVNGNLTAHLLMTQAFIRHWLSVGTPAATIINITSDAGRRTPPVPADQGGWSTVYAATKAGFNRMADMLTLEYGDRGLHILNVNPGLVATERVIGSGIHLKWIADRGVAPADIGDAVARIAHDDMIPSGTYLHAQDYLTTRADREHFPHYDNEIT
ncbi:MAG: SDR family NAD(P)-dependent oxidoreductase [Ilumatobacteraceae bacterium]